jgi:hypothetical protein
MHGTPHEIARQATLRAAAAACGIASPMQATAAAPLWRALSNERLAMLSSYGGIATRTAG